MSKITDTVIQPTVSALIVVIIGVIGFYFSSFAGKADVERNSESITRIGHQLDSVNQKVSGHSKQINNIGSKVDRVLTGLCIINPKTCSLKQKPE